MFYSIILVDKWRKQRRIISSMFSTNLIKPFFSVFNEKSQNLVRNLKRELGKTQQFDLCEYMAQISLDIICREYIFLYHNKSVI